MEPEETRSIDERIKAAALEMRTMASPEWKARIRLHLLVLPGRSLRLDIPAGRIKIDPARF